MSRVRELLSYSFVIPPTIFIVGCLVGAAIAWARPRVGTVISLISASLLYLCATPLVSTFLIGELEALVPPSSNLAAAQAIVVLGGDEQRVSGGSVAVGPLTLERLATAAALYRQTGLPILVSGGTLGDSTVPLSRLMQRELTKIFSIPVKWTEDQSQNTFQNALFSKKLLRHDDINTVLIVTQAWHMPRALFSFEKVGLHAIPFCSIDFEGPLDISDILPSAKAFYQSFYAFHEIIGLAYYRLFY
jgi:uncharacterized SAM-binding protein YcdF (DUF218 family)